MSLNPFDLSKKKVTGPDRRRDTKTWSPEEQQEKLKGYMEVTDQTKWPRIRGGTHVRYYTTEGLFRTGGFVAQNPTTMSIDGKTLTGMRLKSGFDQKSAANWFVGFDVTSRVFAKMDIVSEIILENVSVAIGQLNANIKKLDARLKLTEAKPAKPGE